LFVWVEAKTNKLRLFSAVECATSKSGLLLQKVRAQNYAAIAATTQRTCN
jgi:hypothetical protein